MGVRAEERKARIHDLEMKHQSSGHQIDLVNRDEEARRIKLRFLALRDENAMLKDKVAQRETRILALMRHTDDARTELNEIREQAHIHEALLQKRTADLKTLKDELESTNQTLPESNKLLLEKRMLERELDRLRPELEHLNSQLANHQAVVAEKNSLQRELNTVEVELENEKRSRLRLQQKSDNHVADEWKSRLEAVEKKHAAQKKEWEKAQKAHEHELAESRGETERLEERVSTMKSKLKSVQTQLKETQAELQDSRAELEAARKSSRAAGQKKAVNLSGQVGRKRRVHEISSMGDMSIGTPGPDETSFRRAAKKRGPDASLLEQKSTFSITPFLNRTKNMNDEDSEVQSPSDKSAGTTRSLVEEEEEEHEEHEEAGDGVQPEPEVEHVIEEPEESPQPAPVLPVKKARGRPKKALGDAPTTKKNMPPASKKAPAASKLGKVIEEPEAGEQENVVSAPAPKTKRTLAPKLKPSETLFASGNAMAALDGDAKKKKRKLGGASKTTMFDEEDDGEEIAKPAKAPLAAGGVRKLKAPLGGARNNAFAGATFSPLKRDRKGKGPAFSFLA